MIECPAGQVGVGESCDGKYASCKCDPNLISCSEKEVGQGASCGGRYESCVCKAEYKYTSSNCSYPQSVSGDSCSGKYTNCICPTGVSYGKFGCEEFYPSPCSSVCKIAYVDACYMLKDNTSIYGCMKYWDGCKTKCETPYKDNCRNQNAVSIPANAHCTSYYSDCSSKCSGWSCDPGYKESGNSCIVSGPICEIGYIFYSDNTCVPYTQHDSGKTVLGIVAYVTNGGKHGQIISPWRINSAGNISKLAGASWSTKKTGNIYYGTSSSASMNYDSCANTDKIVAQGDDRTYPAAWATRYYAPTAETKGKWCLPAAGIMSSIYKNQTVIQEAITAVGGVEFASCCYWSSSPYSRSEAWVSDLSSSYGLAHIAKSNFRNVRPVLEY